MRVKIQLFNILAIVTGKGELIYELPEKTTIEDAIIRIFKDYPKIEEMLSNNGLISENFLIVYNKKLEIYSKSVLGYPLEDNCEIMLILPGNGG